MKKKFLFLLSFLLIFSFALFGCNSIKLQGGPSRDETVYGNGGSAVVKGDYLYFANAFVDYAQLGINDNVYDKDKNSNYATYAIYRTKLDHLGKVTLDEDGKPKGAEIITYNVGGYAYAGLYICGDYLYYTTPYSKDATSGETTTGLVRFERVKLDGTGHEILYSADDYSSESSYSIVYVDNITYIVVMNSSKDITLITCNGGNKRVDKIASSVTSYAVFEQKDITKTNQVAQINKYVYYTIKDSDDLYKIFRVSLTTREESVFYGPTSEEVVLKNVKNNRVYFLEGGKLYSMADESLGKVQYTALSFSTDSSSTSNSINNYLIVDSSYGNNLDRGVIGVFYDGSNYSLAYYNKGVTQELNISSDSSKKITLIATQENEFYYQIADDDALYKCVLNLDLVNGTYNIVDYDAGEKLADKFSTSVASTTMLDFDKDRIYVYNKPSEASIDYLTMFMLDSDVAYKDASNKLVGQYIGFTK